jgi:SAM-dependent methyltransferase
MSRLRSYAPTFVKEIVWNWKHRAANIKPQACPHDLVEYVSKLQANSAVLDLGCGAGNLRAALRKRAWKGHYIGVDVSRQVIETAQKTKDDNAEWYVGALEDFRFPPREVDIICLCESLYYVNSASVPALITRCRHSLAPGGRIVIRIWHTDRHREYIATLAAMGAQSEPPLYVLTKERIDRDSSIGSVSGTT